MQVMAIICVRPGIVWNGKTEPPTNLPDGWHFVKHDCGAVKVIFPAKAWYYLAEYLAQFDVVGDAWVLLLTDNFAGIDNIDYSDFEEPALLCLREKIKCGDAWVRHDWDWYQTEPHRSLAYDETSDTAYGDLGAMALPLATLRELVVNMPPNGWNDGANIELARAARNFGLQVKLANTTIRVNYV